VTGGGTGNAEFSLRSLNVKGELTGEYKFNNSSAEGLVNGINNALSQVAADQADKVRSCLQPLRDRLMEIWFPPKSALPPVDLDAILQGGVKVGKVFGGRRSPTNALIYEFVEITNARQFDLSAPFQYHGVILQLIRVKSRVGLDISRPEDGMILRDVTAHVITSSQMENRVFQPSYDSQYTPGYDSEYTPEYDSEYTP
jgi:hypothetical protein